MSIYSVADKLPIGEKIKVTHRNGQQVQVKRVHGVARTRKQLEKFNESIKKPWIAHKFKKED